MITRGLGQTDEEAGMTTVVTLEIVIVMRRERDRSRSPSRNKYSSDGIRVGRVRRLSDKGYGFIEYSDGKSMFFHATGVIQGSFDDLREGDEVEFEAGWDDKSGKDRAKNVLLLH